MKDVAGEAWRLAIEYRDEAAKLGEPPNIGDKPRHVDEAQANSPPPLIQKPTLIIAKGAR